MVFRSPPNSNGLAVCPSPANGQDQPTPNLHFSLLYFPFSMLVFPFYHLGLIFSLCSCSPRPLSSRFITCTVFWVYLRTLAVFLRHLASLVPRGRGVTLIGMLFLCRADLAALCFAYVDSLS